MKLVCYLTCLSEPKVLIQGAVYGSPAAGAQRRQVPPPPRRSDVLCLRLLLPEATQVRAPGSACSSSCARDQRSGGAGSLLKWIHLQILELSQHSRELMYYKRFFFLQKWQIT